VHDEAGSWGNGADPQDIGDRFVSRLQWGHMASLECRLTG